MIRNLKILGLALTVIAISAVAATAAQAQQGFFTSDGPVTLTGSQTGIAGFNALTVTGQKIECPGSTYTGHKYKDTPHALIPSGATRVTLTPHYKQENCKVLGIEWPVTVDMNGCDYSLTLGVTVAGVDTYAATFDVVCPVNQQIQITVFTNASDHSLNKPMCILDIGSQGPLPGLEVKDTTNGHIDIVGSVKGLKITQTSTTHLGQCPEKTLEMIEMDFDLTVSGHNAGGAATPVSISHA
jgi:hypothetical protein